MPEYVICCSNCGQEVDLESADTGYCPNCNKWMLDWEHYRQRKQLREESRAGLAAILSPPGLFDALMNMPDDVWNTAVEADKQAGCDKLAKKPRRAKPDAKKRMRSYKGEEIEMVCPLCGHNRITRYPSRTHHYDG